MKKGRKISNIVFAIDMVLNILMLAGAGKGIHWMIQENAYDMFVFMTLVTLVPAMFLICQIIYFIGVLRKSENAYSPTKIMCVFSVFAKVFVAIIFVIMQIGGVNVWSMFKEMVSAL
nr:hypothetical protein [uncultured Sellimonas sp.]